MSLTTLLAMPWRMMSRAVRWLVVTFAVVLLFGATLAFCARPSWPGGWTAATILTALWLACVGVVLAALLLPALEAQALGLPHVRRCAVVSLWVNAALALLVPAVPLAIFSGHPGAVFGILVLGLMGGAAYALAPLWLIIAASISAAALNGQLASSRWHALHPSDPRFPWICLAAALLAVLVCRWNWRRQLRAPFQSSGVMGRPLVLGFRRMAVSDSPWSLVGGRSATDSAAQAIRHLPRWLQPEVQLNGIGPANIVASLRVALGGLLVPQTPRSHLRRFLLGAAVAMAYALLLGLVPVPGTQWGPAERARIEPLLEMTLAGAFALVTLVPAAQLVGRWQRSSAEISILPLLPGLGDGYAQKRQLLHALRRPFGGFQGLVLLALLGVGSLDGFNPVRFMLLLATLVLTSAAAAVIICATLGHLRVSPWARWMLVTSGLILLLSGLGFVSLPAAVLRGTILFDVFLGLELLYFAVLAGLWARARRALRHAPHPYLGLN